MVRVIPWLLLILPVIIRVLLGVFLTKVYAMSLAEEDFGRIGQFQSMILIATTFVGGGVSLALTKYVAEEVGNEFSIKRLLSSGTLMIVILTFIFSVGMVPLIHHISGGVVERLGPVEFLVSLAVLPLIGVSAMLGGLSIGLGKISEFSRINIYSSLISAGVTFGVVGSYNSLVSAALCLLFSSVLPAIFWLYWYVIRERYPIGDLIPSFDAEYLMKISNFVAMQIVSGLTVQLSAVAVREILHQRLGWRDVGYWNAIVRFSDAYNQMVVSVMSGIFMPRISSEKDGTLIRNKFLIGVALITLTYLALYVFLGIFSRQLVDILLDDKYTFVAEHLAYQSVGDYLKMVSYLAVYVFVARALLKYYVCLEILQALLIVICSYFFVYGFGFSGVVFGGIVAYAIYAAICLMLIFRLFTKRDSI